MKWVLLLGVIVSLASGRTIFDYERDGLDNKQEGSPGQAVKGYYEWRGPDGKITEVSYIADSNGFRLLDDLELRPPSEPFRPAESTQTEDVESVKSAQLRGMEEEEEEEGEEEEENEDGTEEEENEEETEEEDSEGEETEEESSGPEEKDAEVKTAEEETNVEGDGTEAEGGEGAEEVSEPKTAVDEVSEPEEVSEPKTAMDEVSEPAAADKKTDLEVEEKLGKVLDEGVDGEEQKITVTEDKEIKQESTSKTLAVIEARTETESVVVEDAPKLVPVKVESVFPEETSSASEVILADEMQVFPAAEMSPVSEPMVAPLVVSESLSTIEAANVAIAPVSVPMPVELSPVSQDTVASDSSIAAVVIVGDFSPISQDTPVNLDSSNIFEPRDRDVIVTEQALPQVVAPVVEPKLEFDVDSMPKPVFPLAEPLQQPSMEIVSTGTDDILVTDSKTADINMSPEIIPSPAYETSLPEPVILARHISQPKAEIINRKPLFSPRESLTISDQASQIIPISAKQVPQDSYVNVPIQMVQTKTIDERQDSLVDLPISIQPQQVNLINVKEYSSSNLRPVETSSTVKDNSLYYSTGEIQIESTKPTTVIETGGYPNEASHVRYTLDSNPLLIERVEHGPLPDLHLERVEHGPLPDLHLTPKSLQEPYSKSEQSIVPVVEVPVQQPDIFIQAQALSQPQEPKKLEVISVSANQLEKTIQMVPIAVTDSEPIQRTIVSMFEQEGSPQEAGSIGRVFPPSQMTEEQVTEGFRITPLLNSSGGNFRIPVAEDLVVVRSIAEKEIPVKSQTPSATLKVVHHSSPKANGPPLLPPLMKVSRILNSK